MTPTGGPASYPRRMGSTLKALTDELGTRAARALRMENTGPTDRREWWVRSAALLTHPTD